MTTGQLVLLVAVVLALAVGVWRLTTDGRFRGTHRVRGAEAAAAPAAEIEPEQSPLAARLREQGLALGERATLLQFSTAFCAPCRATRRTLADVADVVPGVVHVEIDAEHHLDLVRELGVLRTPTTLVLDAAGVEVRRAAGAPRKETVLATLAEVVS